MKALPISMIITFVSLTFAITSCQSNKSGDSFRKPNIIFIMADDHAYQAMSCYDGSLNSTPNIDRIANEGMLFMNSYVTNSICAPSRAVLLTGKYSHMNGHFTNGHKFDGTQLTFPKVLREAGYETALIGKWHLKSEPQSFDYWNVLPGQGHYYNPDFIEMGEKKRHTGYVTTLTTDFALNYLQNLRDPEKPFCLLLHHKAPHGNWKPEEKYLHLFDNKKINPPDNFFDNYENRGSAAREQEMDVAKHMYWGRYVKLSVNPENGDSTGFAQQLDRFNEEQLASWNESYAPKNAALFEAGLEGEELTLWKFERLMKDYLRCVQSVDDGVGRVLDYLEESGLDENTIVIYTSDQGVYLGEHGWFDKRFMYEESHRMPLVIKYPGKIEPGSINENMVLNLDFAPTFIDYAGVPIPEEIQGESMRPLLENEKNIEWRDAVYYHYFEYPSIHMVKRHYGIRTKCYKLIHFYYDVDEWELYDMEEDPSEMNNIFGKPGTKKITEELTKKLYELKDVYGDTPELEELHMPIKNQITDK